ncbi:MAG: hypothetical protein K8R37_01420, partial [Bacteroidales bacterium]|nr:hypothetical protein [Bacteroidales bacterium]
IIIILLFLLVFLGIVGGAISLYIKNILRKNGFQVFYLFGDPTDLINLWKISKKNKLYKRLFYFSLFLFAAIVLNLVTIIFYLTK